jgi:predicted GNAT family acetyltransferase
MKINQFTNKDIEKEIFKFWQQRYFKCEDDAQIAGTTIISEENMADSKSMSIYHIDRRSFVEIDPALNEKVKKYVEEKCNSGVVMCEDMKALFADQEINDEFLVYLWYLEPEKFNRVEAAVEFSIRQLSQKDAKYLDELKNNCSEEDLEEGDVDIDHSVVFGCFYGDKLVSVSSLIFWGDIIADIGVITHAEFRGIGLGKAVVSALCRWGIDNNRIMQYRAESENEGSWKIAKTLGFTMNIVEEYLEMKK